jgi:hypothetical protein
LTAGESFTTARPYVKGDTLTVPEHLAQEWQDYGYVERVAGKS